MMKKVVYLAVPLLLIALIYGVIRFMPELVGDEITNATSILGQIDKQNSVDQMLLNELNSGAYSFDEPLVVTDPYDISPLTALALFTSEEPLNISVHISGKTKLADVGFTFDGYNTSHQIPIYGLYSGALNTVELIAKTQDGITKTTTLQIQTDPLPPEMAKNIIQTELMLPNNYQPGFNYTFDQKSAFDVNGDYRWYYKDFYLVNISDYNYHGNDLFVKGSSGNTDMFLFETNALGKILSVYSLPYDAHHEIVAIDDKSLIILGNNGDTIEDFIYEIDVQSGEVVNKLDLKQVLQRTRIVDQQDWLHLNSLVYDNGSIIISNKNQSAVVKLSWPEGKIDWILSDHYGWRLSFQKYLLTPIGGEFEWQYHQHAAKVLPDLDNNPDTIDIMLFDNGNDRFDFDREIQLAIAKNEVLEPEPYSRMVHYRINEKDRIVEQIWQFGKELGETYYSVWKGSAYLLENGNRLGTFDVATGKKYDAIMYGDGALFIPGNHVISPEVTTEGELVWEAYITTDEEISDYTAYRIERMSPYTYAANDLQIGTPARNLTQGGTPQ